MKLKNRQVSELLAYETRLLEDIKVLHFSRSYTSLISSSVVVPPSPIANLKLASVAHLYALSVPCTWPSSSHSTLFTNGTTLVSKPPEGTSGVPNLL